MLEENGNFIVNAYRKHINLLYIYYSIAIIYIYIYI